MQRAKLFIMRASNQLRSLLREGDRRTLGRVAEVIEAVLREPKLVSAVVECTVEADERTRMRAADALENISRKRVEELQSYTLGLFEKNEQQELRWHLAVILPRLTLNASERSRTSHALQQCMTAKSSMVKAFALQGLSDLTLQEPSLTPLVLDLLRLPERDGTSAMVREAGTPKGAGKASKQGSVKKT